MRTELEQPVPLGRLADPGEIGATIKFLAPDGAAYVTGTIVTVAGGVNAT